MIATTSFTINKNDIKATAITKHSISDIPSNAILIQIDRFGFSSNNVTYALFGKAMQYFDFFEAGNGYAHLPIWGVGTIIKSNNDQLKEGEKVYGYFPTASHIILEPVGIKIDSFKVIRDQLPADRYHRENVDPEYSSEFESLMLLFRPLWTTSFFLNDFLEAKFDNVRSIVISSASSKTAFSLALLLKKRGIKAIGITSKRNEEFVKHLGFYDKVVCYDQISQLEIADCVYCDFAGDSNLNSQLFSHFGDCLQKHVVIGKTHVESGPSGEKNPRTVFFFVPEWILKRTPKPNENLVETKVKEWKTFLQFIQPFVDIKISTNPGDLQAVYLEMLKGSFSPSDGFIFSLVTSSHL
ncbi:hypothetical protein HK103_005706 [Boothiomyces macroporosus]|uniref:DUF2855 family protein n=1 Tax=Boothiomyces macroporosus TaxID=261099 RepID=A0AAD5UFH6_9FUNG|nr:hypothetical protein HK103_005706 [Boothiomyces macroporosus]